MSWGFFADLQIALPTRAWTALQKKTPADLPLLEGWSGFEEPALSAAFAAPSGPATRETFREILAWPVLREECIRREEREGGRVHVRVALLLDKSQLDVAGYLGALLEGVRLAGFEGTLTLVNDGTYVGESGRVVEVRGGERVDRRIDDPRPIVEALGAELYPDALEDADEDEDEDEDEVEDESDGEPARPDPDLALGGSFACYQRGDVAGARAWLDGYFRGGGAPRADLLTNYTAFLRAAPPEGADLEAAHDTVLGAFRAAPALLANVALLENAVAFLNEHGRAREGVELVLDAVARGTPWSAALAVNVTCSASVARDDAATDRVLAALLPAIDSDPARFEPHAAMLFANLAGLHAARGRADAAFEALARSLSIDPGRRAKVAGDPYFVTLHDDPRWSTLVAEEHDA